MIYCRENDTHSLAVDIDENSIPARHLTPRHIIYIFTSIVMQRARCITHSTHI